MTGKQRSARSPKHTHPRGTSVRTRDLVAFEVPIVYNNDGDCDPSGLIFAPKAHLPLLVWLRDQLLSGDRRLLRLHTTAQQAQLVVDGLDRLAVMLDRLTHGGEEEQRILDEQLRLERDDGPRYDAAGDPATGQDRLSRRPSESTRAHAIRSNLTLTLDELRGALIALGESATTAEDRRDQRAEASAQADGIRPAAPQNRAVGEGSARGGLGTAVASAIRAELATGEPTLRLVGLSANERAALRRRWYVQLRLTQQMLSQLLGAITVPVQRLSAESGIPEARVRQLLFNAHTPAAEATHSPHDTVNPLRPMPLIAPLVLRAHVGECVHLRLENHLSTRRVGLHVQGEALGRHDSTVSGQGVRFGDGSHLGDNPDSTVSAKSGNSLSRITYTYGAVHEGVWMLGDLADVRGDALGSNVHGLFGALIVEPAGVTWHDPATGTRLDDKAWDSQLLVDIHDPAEPDPAAHQFIDFHHDGLPRSFREFTIFLHDEPSVHSGLHTAGLHSWMPISYRAEPMVNRLPHRMRRLVEATPPEPAEDQQGNDLNAFHWELGEEFDDEFWTARTPDGRWLERVAGEEQHHSSWLFGEPATPVLRAYAGDPCRIRLVHGGVKETHVYHLHVHQWRAVAADTAEPGVWGTDSSDAPRPKGSQLIDSITISPQTALTIDPLYGSGSRQHAPGDIIWHCHLYPHFHHGMWGLWRSFDRLVDGSYPYPDGTPCAALQPLPGRRPEAPTPQRPGFPWFIGARFPVKSPPPPAPVPAQVGGRRRLLGLPAHTATEWAAMPEPVRDGSRPGGVFVDLDGKAALWNAAAGLPAPRIVSYDLESRIDRIDYNTGGWHDPRGCHYEVRAAEVRVPDGAGGYVVEAAAVFPHDPAANPEPQFPRANHGDIVELRMHNALRSLTADQEDFAMHPVECGLHVHLVKFDVLSADGSATGWNYLSGASCREAVGPDLPGELTRTVSLHRWVVDEEFGPCFFHDHLLANYRQKHGLWSALIAEPYGSQWLSVDQERTAWSQAQAVIVPEEATGLPPYREACLSVQDFVPLMDRRGRSLNPPTVLSGVDDPGVMAVSYRSAPMHFRGADPSLWFSTAVGAEESFHGTPGDPDTPLIETYPGERLRIRLIQGSHEEGHNFQTHGLRWRRDWGNPAAPLVNQQAIGISEAFTLEIDPQDASRYGVGDHLWHLGGLDDLWLGCWGYVRALQPTRANRARFAPLPTTSRSPLCPPVTGVDETAAGAPVRTFVVVAQRTEHLFQGRHLSDPWGLIYRVAEFSTEEYAEARRTGRWRPRQVHDDDRPLVLRARRGERIRVFLVNDLLRDDDTYAELPRLSVEVAPPRLFVEHLDANRMPDRRSLSPRVSLHPSLLQRDLRSHDGSFVGRNPDGTVSPAAVGVDHGEHVEGGGPVVHRPHGSHEQNWREYRWYADEALAPASHVDGAGRVCVLKDMADVRNHRHHGLIGALVVLPGDVTPWQPGSPAGPGEGDGWHGVEAEIRSADGTLVAHEGVVFFQDGLRQFVDGHPSLPVSDIELEDENELDSGQKALNYRTALIHRGRPPVGADADPPLVRATAGQPLWLRAVGAGDKLRQHCVTLHGLVWQQAPWVPDSGFIAAQSGVVGGWSEDLVVLPRSPGDHAVRTGCFLFGTELGVWGVIRVR